MLPSPNPSSYKTLASWKSSRRKTAFTILNIPDIAMANFEAIIIPWKMQSTMYIGLNAHYLAKDINLLHSFSMW